MRASRPSKTTAAPTTRRMPRASSGSTPCACARARSATAAEQDRSIVKTLLLLLGGAKFGKVLLTSGTMLVSIGAYALLWGWPFAVGFVLLIFLHEMGHYVAARQRGLNVGAPTFIPFVGAWIELKDLPHNAETEAYVGMAGPVAGTAASLACYEAGRFLDSPLLVA